MANSTFSGPIRAGTIRDTTGTTLGDNVANVGQVMMAQTQAITQSATSVATNIVIPANSQIVEITFYVTTAWGGGTTTIDVGTDAGAAIFASAVSLAAVGIASATPGTDATRTGAWIDVGTSDVRIKLINTSGGAGAVGVGAITVRYLQNVNLL